MQLPHKSLWTSCYHRNNNILAGAYWYKHMIWITTWTNVKTAVIENESALTDQSASLSQQCFGIQQYFSVYKY